MSTAQFQQVKLPTQALQAEILPGSANSQDRTVDVVWSTGQKILFHDWEIGDYYLTLGLDEQNVRLDFARQGAPVLDAHSMWSASSVMGVIDQISVDGTVGRARLRFSKRPEAESIWMDVADGILRFVSVGTRLHGLEDISQDDDKIPHYLAVDHEPIEISIAPVPRDTGAVMQAEKESERFPVVVSQSAHAARTKEGQKMTTKTTKSAAKKAADKTEPEVVEQSETVEEAEVETKKPAKAAPVVEQAVEEIDSEAIAKQASDGERARVVEIRKIAKQARLGDEFADRLIEEGTSVEQASRAAIEAIAERDDAANVRTGVTVGREETETIRQSVESALLHRIRPSQYALEQRAHEFVGMSMIEITRELLAKHGISTRGLAKPRIAEMAFHSTSDFPEILANVANKTLRMGYENTPRTFVGWCREAIISDFKQVSRTQLGEAPALEIVRESGEFRHGTMGEAAEKYQLATYGKIVAVTRQAIINDDLSAFDRVIPAMGLQAANLQSDLVYAILTSNPNMADGVALFASGHGNQSGAAAAPSVTTLGAGRAAMRSQKGVDGVTPINVMPRSLIVPVALETVAEQLVTGITANESGQVNPFAGNLAVVPEPRLDAASASVWYLAADPGSIDTIEYAFLEGQTGPYIETRNGFDTDGVEIKVRLDFAAKAIDHRGLYRNS